jgi:oligoendopeptidase F
MVEAVAQQVTGAEEVVWNLADLAPSITDESIKAILDGVLKDADAFAAKYRGRVASLSAAEMVEALNAAEAIVDPVIRLSSYAGLQWTTDTNNADFGALMQRLREFDAQLQQTLLFFTLEWTNAPDESTRILTDSLLKPFKHYLAKERQLRPHRLSEPEEKILEEKSVTGRGAWGRFFTQTLSATQYELDGQKYPQEVVLKKLYDADRDMRLKAATSITNGLRSQLPTLTYVFNVALADKFSDDKLRKFPTWISARNLDNEASDQSVDALISAVTSRYDIVARYYALKKQLLGYGELYDYDRYAPLEQAESFYSWAHARDMILAAFYAFDPQIGSIAQEFFDKRWIHAPVTQGKRSGAFASPTSTQVHPYIFVNYRGKGRDVMTLAHELGHGIHMRLSQPRGMYGASTPLTTAETASVFGEMMVFNDLMVRERNPHAKLSMLAQKIEDTFATVFRQISMNRFEDAIHTARRTTGELRSEQIGEYWMQTQRAMFRDSVTLRDDYSVWWSYVSHFISVPGYVYAYAFGELLVMALLAEYRKQGNSFAPRYIEMLAAGGSESPENIVAKVGINLNDPNFWAGGVTMIEDMVLQAEKLVEQL